MKIFSLILVSLAFSISALLYFSNKVGLPEPTGGKLLLGFFSASIGYWHGKWIVYSFK